MNVEGNWKIVFQYIVDHRYNGTEVKEQDAIVPTRTKKKRRRETTNRVEVLIQCKDGGTTWVTLNDMKNSYPVHMAKYAVQLRIAGDPAFAWWIQNVLAKRNRIIGKLKSKYLVQTHKFGVKISKSVQESKAFYEDNGNTLWCDAICKEMKNIRPDLEVWEKDILVLLQGY